MQTQNFDHLLENIRNGKIPQCPPQIADATLRHIRLQQSSTAAPANAPWSQWINIYARPQMVAALLVIAITISIITTTLAASGLSRSYNTPASAKDPLGLRVLVNPASLECLPHCPCGIDCACNAGTPSTGQNDNASPSPQQ